MAYEFQKLADVEAVEEFPEEGASVLIEHEGGIKKCPADGIGGGTEIPVVMMSVGESGQEFEFADGRTLDSFVEEFEKNGSVQNMLLKMSTALSEPGMHVTYNLTLGFIYDMDEEYGDGTMAGGKTIAYSIGGLGTLTITNINNSTGEKMDHYVWAMGGY